jgi:tRNA dimethylallyltransferase
MKEELLRLLKDTYPGYVSGEELSSRFSVSRTAVWKWINGLKEMGYTKNMVSMQGIGYKEIFDYLENKYTIEETKDIIKQSSRRYAKRQLTWFRRDENIFWVEVDKYPSINEVTEKIIDYIEGYFNLL